MLLYYPCIFNNYFKQAMDFNVYFQDDIENIPDEEKTEGTHHKNSHFDFTTLIEMA